MLKPNDVLLLRQILEEEAQNSSYILGAHIGGIVKKKFPEMSIKNEFGSLGKLINAHFADLMSFDGKHGNDNKYIFLSQNLTALTGNQDSSNVSENTAEKTSDATPARGSAVAQKRALCNTEQLQSNTDARLRQAIKNAVDVMTPEQLRQLVLPAGILFDAISKAIHA